MVICQSQFNINVALLLLLSSLIIIILYSTGAIILYILQIYTYVQCMTTLDYVVHIIYRYFMSFLYNMHVTSKKCMFINLHAGFMSLHG